MLVLSNDFWRRRLGGNRNVIGEQLTLNGERYSVIGVMPADFRFFTKTDVWSPLAFDPKEQNERKSNYLELIGRLKPGVSIEQATGEADQNHQEFLQ